MHQNISLWSNGVDQMRSLRKIPTRLRGMKFCTSSARFAPSFVRQPNGPECTQIVRNAPKREFRVNGVDRVRLLQKIATRLHGMNICTSSACFAPSFVRQQNGPECTQIVRNAPKREFLVNGVDRVRLLQKIPTRLHGMNICTSSSCFVPSFVRQPKGPECTQIVQKCTKTSV